MIGAHASQHPDIAPTTAPEMEVAAHDDRRDGERPHEHPLDEVLSLLGGLFRTEGQHDRGIDPGRRHQLEALVRRGEQKWR